MTLNLKIDSVIMRHDLMRNETKETIEQLEDIADDFAIGFAEWYIENELLNKLKSNKQLLQIYKKEQGL